MRGLVLGRLYQVDWYPGFVPDNEGYEVQGDVFRVDPGQLDELDQFEGLPPGALAGEEYERVKIRVRRDRKGEVVWRAFPDELDAWVWIWRKPVADFAEVPSGNWLNVEGVAERAWCTSFGCLGLLAIPVGGATMIGLLRKLSIVLDPGTSIVLLLLAASGVGLTSAALARKRRERVRFSFFILIAGSVIALFLAMICLSKIMN